MKGPFSIWPFFGLTLWIDVFTHLFKPDNEKRINPYNPLKEISVIIPLHKESEETLKRTISSVYKEKYPVKNIIICGDSQSIITAEFLRGFRKKNLHYVISPYTSKARKINYIVEKFDKGLGEFIYVIDCGTRVEQGCIEKMISCFNNGKIATVTSYGRVNTPRNFLSRSYFYGKAWINEIGRFRKSAQEKRGALFVICGASAIYRKAVLKKIPIPSRSKTEDTYYTWLLQENGYRIRVADDAVVSAPEVDGKGLSGIKGQIKQSYRWSSGTMQCLFLEGKALFKNKRLAYSTILPGFLESIMYAVPLFLLPLIFFIFPWFALGFLIGDTVFSLLGTLIFLPKKFWKTLAHYPQIMFFKYVNAGIFFIAALSVTFQAVFGITGKWNNEWTSPNLMRTEI